MTNTRFTIVIPWANRPELERTLHHNIPAFKAMAAETVVVNCGGDGRWLRGVLSADDLVGIRQVDVPVNRFNRSLALNVGIHGAGRGVVFLLDADILINGSLRRYAEICASQRCFALFPKAVALPAVQPYFTPPPGSVLKEIVTSHVTSFVWADGTVTRVERDRKNLATLHRLLPGMMIVGRDHLLEIGGFRSSFVGWGFEDIDLQVRLQRIGLAPLDVEDEIVHLEHGDDKRDLDGETREQVERRNIRRARTHYCNGEFMGTLRSDVQMWESLTSQASVATSADMRTA